MKNTDNLKRLIIQAISASSDFALKETQNHLKAALTKLESIEKKRVKREEIEHPKPPPKYKNEYERVKAMITPKIDYLDKMIQLERDKQKKDISNDELITD